MDFIERRGNRSQPLLTANLKEGATGIYIQSKGQGQYSIGGCGSGYIYSIGGTGIGGYIYSIGGGG